MHSLPSPRPRKRIFVTFDVADFPRIVRQWAEEGRSYAGCAIVVGIDHRQFGTILRFIARTLGDRPDPLAWRDYSCFVSRRA